MIVEERDIPAGKGEGHCERQQMRRTLWIVVWNEKRVLFL
jgi:hypothetical protein